jgi:DNA-binding IscR family transcriptional regulator
MSIAELANHLHMAASMVKEFMEMFAQAKLVLPLADEETFVLGRDPETIKIKDILDCIRNSGKTTKLQTGKSQAADEVNELLVKIDQSMAQVLEGKNLQTLILNAPSVQG